jgi:pyruvate/2-oxoglutarate dehydrogenase complex dihydrolipoamide dehydrogenase (E3) component
MTRRFDALIIGTGQAGPFLASRLAASGMKVAVVERKFFGGTCVNTGCTPTKAMVASAHAAHLARRAAEFGIGIDGAVSVDMRQVKARKDSIVQQSRGGLKTWLEGMDNCTVFHGQARFESAHEITLNDERLTADRIFINVGGRAAVPRMSGLDQIEFFTNSTLLDIDFVPRHLVVIGGSYVGLEFAQMFRRFGSEVTVVEMGPQLMRR